MWIGRAGRLSELTERDALTGPVLIPQQVGRRRMASLRDYVSLTKPKIALLNVLTALVCYFAAGGGSLGAVALSAAGYLAAGGSTALNNYLDVDLDSRMRRTSRRPLPSGRVSRWAALVLGLVSSTASLALSWLALNPLATLFIASGMLFYVVVYTLLLKRRTVWNVVIGGVAGSFPPLAGWAAATGEIGLPAVLLAVLVFLWTPGHFWALAIRGVEEYRAAGLPMLPVRVGVERASRITALSNLSALPVWAAGALVVPSPTVYVLASLPLTAPFALYSLRLLRSPDPQLAWRSFKASSPWLATVSIALLASIRL
ncbi:MAG: heme o synthase [Nitrososphaeria archaeon]|nr:heme o synthase [Nitrososphaeria archaeon]